MIDEAINEIGIDDQGRLYVVPASASFDFIYRAAMEVNWDAPRKRLYGAKPRVWGYLDWFRQLISAARDEYGVRLNLTPDTVWTDVPDILRVAIQSAAEPM